MNRKTVICSVLLACLLLSACAEDKKEIITVEGVKQAAAEPSPSPSPAPAAAPETPAPAEEPSPAPEKEKPLLGVYSAEKYKYTNDFFSLSFSAGEDWVFVKKAELADLMKINLDQYEEDVRELIKSEGAAYDMAASSVDGMKICNVMVQRVPANYDLSQDITELLNTNAAGMPAGMREAGYGNVECSVGTVKTGGKEIPCLYTTADYSGLPYYCRQVFVLSGNYMAVVTAASYNADFTEEILNMFTIEN